jgi:catechol 2,3-dioxygenase-like lactoylglutathione lyase family enzyme
MTVTIRQVFLPFLDLAESLTFYCDGLGFEMKEAVGSGPTRDLVLQTPGDSHIAIVLESPGNGLSVAASERRTIRELMRKGCYAKLTVASADFDDTFERLESTGAEVLQEPIARPEGRDCVFLDPAGTLIRIVESA